MSQMLSRCCHAAGPTEDDEPFVHSFYDDVAQNPQIVRAMLAVTHGIQKAASGLARVTEGWKVHQPLWKLDKATSLDKFKVRAPAGGDTAEAVLHLVCRFFKLA